MRLRIDEPEILARAPASLSTFDRRVLAVLISHCFWGRSCWPSQALIAEHLGCSREAVNRSCARLRVAGVITWDWRRGVGRWCHNVYTVLVPFFAPNRAAVMRRLAALRGRRATHDHTKGVGRTTSARPRAVWVAPWRQITTSEVRLT